MKRFSLIALALLTGPAFAAQGITFPYQMHFACSLVITGNPQPAPDVYIAINSNSGAMTIQRPGFEKFYAKQHNPFTWEEMNVEEGYEGEMFVLFDKGEMSISQGGQLMQKCVEVN